MRSQIRSIVSSIVPLDVAEESSQQSVLNWIDSGVDLCRREKPATPPRHLVSYFVVVDGDHLLLVDHINAELWLPTGGHVEPNEHPADTVVREAKEELKIDAKFRSRQPLFLTETVTVGKTSGHLDVSLWFVLAGTHGELYDYETAEFNDVRWFHKDQVPMQRTDQHMARFIQKLYGR